MSLGMVKRIDAKALREKVDPIRQQQVMDEGAVPEAARSMVDCWGRRSTAGSLLMPATSHSLVHPNEALRLKGRRQ